MSEYQVITPDFVKVNITNSAHDSHSVERRFQKNITVQEFKEKLELLTGGRTSTMTLEVYDKDNKLICKLNENNRLLGSYPIDDGMRIHVTDNFAKLEEDLSQVEKFELSEEEYAKRSDTLKAFLEKNKLGKYNEEDMKRKEEVKQKELLNEDKLLSTMKIGDRCEVTVPNNPKRRATIMFLGKCDFKPGNWVGVKYDEPLGKNDGSVNGKRYFQCSPNYGGFVKPNHVVVGDFPEEDYDLNEEL